MAANDGIENPSGFAWAGAAGLYLAFIPITNYITTDGGVLQKAVQTLVRVIPGCSNIPQDRVIPALGAWYLFATFAASGAASVAGQAASRKGGLDNNNPRAHVNTMTGLPLRLRSAHYNLLENFPAWALAAGLTQAIAPGNQKLLNLLGLSAVLKTLIYYPCYLLDIAPPRSLAHLFATSAVINATWQLATGAR